MRVAQDRESDYWLADLSREVVDLGRRIDSLGRSIETQGACIRKQGARIEARESRTQAELSRLADRRWGWSWFRVLIGSLWLVIIAAILIPLLLRASQG